MEKIELNNKSNSVAIVFQLLTPFIVTAFLIAGCQGQPQTAPPDYSVISSPEVPIIETDTPTPQPTATELPSKDDPTTATDSTLFEMVPAKVIVTPEAATATLEPEPTEPPEEEAVAEVPTEATEEDTAEADEETEATATPAPPAPSLDEPRSGGIWDMEEGFEVWLNPYGDNCSGSKIAVGWNGFTSRGAYGSSCFYLNDYAPKVFSGKYSQQISFDFVDSHAGIYRTIDTQPGHTYQVTVRIWHFHTLPAMQYYFGVDSSGGANWEADTVSWQPWSEFVEQEWMTHQQTFAATGEKTTIFIRGFHDTATQGGETNIDAIEIIDLG